MSSAHMFDNNSRKLLLILFFAVGLGSIDLFEKKLTAIHRRICFVLEKYLFWTRLLTNKDFVEIITGNVSSLSFRLCLVDFECNKFVRKMTVHTCQVRDIQIGILTNLKRISPGIFLRTYLFIYLYLVSGPFIWKSASIDWLISFNIWRTS